MSESPNPYAATTLEIANVPLDGETYSRTIHWLAVLALPLMLIGASLAVWEIESIIASGPVMLVYGLILLFFSHWHRQRAFQWFGWACCALPFVVFLIIFTMSWSPDEAQVPISSLCSLFAVVASAGILITLSRTVTTDGHTIDSSLSDEFTDPGTCLR